MKRPCSRKPFPPKERRSRLTTESLEVSKNTIGLMALLTIIVVGVLMSLSVSFAQNPKTYIPPKAFDLRDTLYDEIRDIVPELPDYNYVPALIEHESCISLKHSRCWSPDSELSNKREYSVGFFQIAKAYNADGSVRMDTLKGLKQKYKTRLAEASWDNLKHRPDLQMRAGLALIRENWNHYRTISDPWERLAFADAGYNGGPGNVDKERRACGLKKGCDPNKWFGNVETTCLRGKNIIPAYGRSICQISRDHPQDVLYNRLPKYKQQYFNEDYVKNR